MLFRFLLHTPKIPLNDPNMSKSLLSNGFWRGSWIPGIISFLWRSALAVSRNGRALKSDNPFDENKLGVMFVPLRNSETYSSV